MGIEVKTFEDAVKVDVGFLKGLYIIENESTGRGVSIIIDENCIRWQGFAKGAEAHMMGVSDKKLRQYSYGWIPVRGRHEFRNGDGDKCVRNALRFVNDTARSYLKAQVSGPWGGACNPPPNHNSRREGVKDGGQAGYEGL